MVHTKRKKTIINTTNKTIKLEHAEEEGLDSNEIEKRENKPTDLDIFESDETDDDKSEDVDELMPSRKKSSSSKKRSSTSTNKQKPIKKASSRSKKSAADSKNSTATKIKSAWRPEEDKILIDKILEEMQSPSWSKISRFLKDRNPNACLIRWRTLKKRLYQNN